MEKLSPNAQRYADALYKHYNSDVAHPKYFDDIHFLGLSDAELQAVFTELEEYGLAIAEQYDDSSTYLYILFGLIDYKKTGTLKKIPQL